MLIRKCDICQGEIKNNYWTISIREHSDNWGRNTANGAANNLIENTRLMKGQQKEYCENCINKIKDFIENRSTKENDIEGGLSRQK